MKIRIMPHYNKEGNSVYKFIVESDGGLNYKVQVVIDELYDSKVLFRYSSEIEKTHCNCKAYELGKKHKCKHIQFVLDYLRNTGIEVWEDKTDKARETEKTEEIDLEKSREDTSE